MARQYAQIVGIVLILLGVVGLLAAGQVHLFGALNVDLSEDIIHIVVGALLAYVGFTNMDAATVRTIVGVLGVVFLLLGIIGFPFPTAFGIVPNGWTVVDNIVHLLLGILGIAAGFLLDRTTTVTVNR